MKYLVGIIFLILSPAIFNVLGLEETGKFFIKTTQSERGKLCEKHKLSNS